MFRFSLVALLVLAFLSPLPAEGRTRSQFEHGWLTFFDSSTLERIRPMSPWFWEDQFFGSQLNLYDAGTASNAVWTEIDTSTAAGWNLVADEVPGVASVELTTGSGAERGVLYWGDHRPISIEQNVGFEAKVKPSVLPTGNSQIIVGLAGGDNASPASVVSHVWFFVAADADLVYHGKGGTAAGTGSTGTTIVATDWYLLRIEVIDKVARFFVNNNRVASVSMAGISASNAKMQPYFAVQKASGTGVGTLQVEYVRLWGNRP